MRFFGLWVRDTERASCIALREAARVSVWERVPWWSKSLSPRRGRVGWSVVLERCESDVGEVGGLGRFTARGWIGSGSLGSRRRDRCL